MISSRRISPRDKISWSDSEEVSTQFEPLNLVKTFECWRYEGNDEPQVDENYRTRTFQVERNQATRQKPVTRPGNPNDFEGKLAEKLLQSDVYGRFDNEKPERPKSYSVQIEGQNKSVEDAAQLNQSSPGSEDELSKWLLQSNPDNRSSFPNATKFLGGMRVVFCDRMVPFLGINISKRAFESIESSFRLHPETLSLLSMIMGAFSIFTERDPTDTEAKVTHYHVMVKVAQKTEIGNSLLSLRYDVNRSWTDAFICGAGVVQSPTSSSPTQAGEMIAAMLTNSTHLWNNPLLLPYILLQIYSPGCELIMKQLGLKLVEMEEHIGVTETPQTHPSESPSNWPLNIDVEKLTKDLHTIAPQMIAMKDISRWRQRYIKFLLDIGAEMSVSLTQKTSTKLAFIEMKEHLAHTLSIIDANVQFLATSQVRTELQTNVLYSIIGQRNSIINATIANASKRDSISIATFTFITAFFLPGTFIATVFSMSMFDWQAMSRSEVVSDFWIYWAVSAPLTIITLAGWYIWFKYATHAWDETMEKMSTPDETLPKAPATSNRTTPKNRTSPFP